MHKIACNLLIMLAKGNSAVSTFYFEYEWMSDGISGCEIRPSFRARTLRRESSANFVPENLFRKCWKDYGANDGSFIARPCA